MTIGPKSTNITLGSAAGSAHPRTQIPTMILSKDADLHRWSVPDVLLKSQYIPQVSPLIWRCWRLQSPSGCCVLSAAQDVDDLTT